MSLSDAQGALLLVGAGKMGGAMLQSWLADGLPPAQVLIHDPAPSDDIKALASEFGIALNTPPEMPLRAILLAVKPQMMADVLTTIAPLAGPDTLIMSVAAGTTIARFEAAFGADQPIIRVMPNTPAAIGRGMLVACANDTASEDDKHVCQALIEASGAVVWIDDEAHMDAVTAVSGSGPAYVFYLAECLEKAALSAGLPAELAAQLARVTVEGAGELLHRSDEDAAVLRQNVTSPGGTTAAALKVLMADDGLAPLMTKAVAAAAARSRDLAG